MVTSNKAHDIHVEICHHCNRLFVRTQHGEYRRDYYYYWSRDRETGITGNPIHGSQQKEILK